MGETVPRQHSGSLYHLIRMVLLLLSPFRRLMEIDQQQSSRPAIQGQDLALLSRTICMGLFNVMQLLLSQFQAAGIWPKCQKADTP